MVTVNLDLTNPVETPADVVTTLSACHPRAVFVNPAPYTAVQRGTVFVTSGASLSPMPWETAAFVQLVPLTPPPNHFHRLFGATRGLMGSTVATDEPPKASQAR